jgi:mRNA-degrading endonuclease RelE of RelBE toxin-antitoxin system
MITKLPEFEKEYKKLCKKYFSLESDFLDFEKDLKVRPKSHIQIQGLGSEVKGEFYKVKKFRCDSISRQSQQSGIRIIYRYLEEDEKIELTYIEMYHKNQKSNHDIERIKQWFKS